MPTKLLKQPGGLKKGESRILKFKKRSITIEGKLDIYIEDLRGNIICRSSLINEVLMRARTQGIFEEIIYELRRKSRI